MKRILLSLMIMLIALTAIASVSASSDFNQTVDGDFLSDVDEAAVPVDQIVEIDNESAINEVPMDVNNVTFDVDDSVDSVDAGADVVFDNSTDANALCVIPNENKLKLVRPFEMPEVSVTPTIGDTGDRIQDAVVYYTAFYNEYVKIFDEKKSQPLSALTILVYQSFDEKDTIDIVSKVYIASQTNTPSETLRQHLEKLTSSLVSHIFYDLYGERIWI